MALKQLRNLEEVAAYKPASNRKFLSAEHDEILSGLTTDIYFVRTSQLLNRVNKAGTPVVAEVFARRQGIFAGTQEVINLFQGRKVELWSLPEGTQFEGKEVVMRIEGPYEEFGIYETVLLGILASSSGWATAANEAKRAAGDKPVLCFGARHVHPAVAPVMERCAIIGGADGASCILGAKLAGMEPAGTVPHAFFLIMGDTVEGATLYNEFTPPDASRVIIADTFNDEAIETLRLAEALGDDLEGVRLDTPSERGGVTPELIKEVKYRLEKSGFNHVKIFVSGGLTPERIAVLTEAEQTHLESVPIFRSKAHRHDNGLESCRWKTFGQTGAASRYYRKPKIGKGAVGGLWGRFDVKENTVAAAAAIILFVIMAAVGYSSEKETGDVLSTSGVESSNENVFKVNLTTNPITVDPAKAVSESELLLVRALYDTLVDYQGGSKTSYCRELGVF